jgi:Nif-specific regulatory protein
MVILAEGDRITLGDLPANVHHPVVRSEVREGHSLAEETTVRAQPPFARSLSQIEREEVKAALMRNGWVQVRAARELGLTQRQMGYRIKKYGLSRYDSFRP